MIVWCENARPPCPAQQAVLRVACFVSCCVLVTASCKRTRNQAHIHTYIRPHIYVQMYTFYYHRDKDNLYTVHAALGHCGGKLIKACFNRIEQICEKRVATELRLSSHLIQDSWHFVRFLMLGKDSLMRTEIASQKSNSVWMVWPFTPGLCGLYDVYLTAAVVSTLVSSQGH